MTFMFLKFDAKESYVLYFRDDDTSPVKIRHTFSQQAPTSGAVGRCLLVHCAIGHDVVYRCEVGRVQLAYLLVDSEKLWDAGMGTHAKKPLD